MFLRSNKKLSSRKKSVIPAKRGEAERESASSDPSFGGPGSIPVSKAVDPGSARRRPSGMTIFIAGFVLVFVAVSSWGNDMSVSGGLSLIQISGARPLALGEAFSPVQGDIAAFGYNPGSLSAWGGKQANVTHQKGLVDDSFSQGMFGVPFKNGGLGISFGAYDGGEVESHGEGGEGLEVGYGMLRLRGGYKFGNESEDLSLGAGFLLGRSAIDYSFGVMNEFDTQHRITYGYNFGSPPASPKWVRHIQPEETPSSMSQTEQPTASDFASSTQSYMIVTNQVLKEPAPQSRPKGIYAIRPDDTLKTISHRVYGDEKNWKEILEFNKVAISDPTQLPIGKHIALPF